AEETIEEIRFYLAQSMIEQARAVFARLLKLKPSAATVSALREEIEAATAQVAGIEPEAIEEVSVEEAEAPAEEITPPPMPKQKPGVLKEFVSNLESSLGEGFLPQTTAKEITPHPAPAMAEVAQRSEEHTSVLQSRGHLVCRLLLEKKKTTISIFAHNRHRLQSHVFTLQ